MALQKRGKWKAIYSIHMAGDANQDRFKITANLTRYLDVVSLSFINVVSFDFETRV